MANTKISGLTALAGADVDTAADVLAIVDTGVTTTKKILVDELAIAMRATQAEMEGATSVNTTVAPSILHFHPAASKGWGLVTTPTTVTTSYPASGVSVTNPGTGQYVVTHGLTFSSANYVVSVLAGSTLRNARIDAQDATTFTVAFFDSAGNAAAATNFRYVVFGDLS